MSLQSPGNIFVPVRPQVLKAPTPLFSLATEGQLEPWRSREWLLTNGLGGFASSSVIGCNIRRYHGLLCAATMPPVGRVMILSRVGEVMYLDGKMDRPLEFSSNQFGVYPATFHPRGDRYLRRFELGETARWTYDIEGVRVVKELLLCWQKNAVALRYTLDGGGPGGTPARPMRLELSPFTGLRDFHALRRAGGHFEFYAREKGVRVVDWGLSLNIAADAGTFVAGPDWWYGHTYPIEADRGSDCTEDLFTPGRFVAESSGAGRTLTITLWASTQDVGAGNWDAELRKLVGRRVAVSAPIDLSEGKTPTAASKAAPPRKTMSSPALARLFRAADDFLVYRKSPDGSDGTSVVAGYPWFADWGRDTFISLPGLMLVTGRFEQAKQVLGVFGNYVSQGMIPNRFDDYNDEPCYNTVDASLWYIHAAFEYLRLSRDKAGFEQKMLPACRQIIEGYKAGTRYNIKMEDDGLITQGDWSTQLTWMDAKSEGHAFTPRQGKAVEINALWYHALILMGQIELAGKVAQSFRKAFWIDASRGLYDVVDGDRRDSAIRPNQIFAVSLPNSALTADQQAAVVDIVRRELLTPFGLRTLSPSDPGYKGWYNGPQPQRDAAYHNGTVWAWPIGAFLSAYLRVNKRSPQSLDQARKWLQPLIDHLGENCIGQIAEIFEGNEPHTPKGCPAQAWSVAEVLRLAAELGM
jgi:predicted glycogen debranching enzyme